MKMNDLQIAIAETMENICDKFCKYSGTGSNGECCYCATHEGECPFDELAEKVGLK